MIFYFVNIGLTDKAISLESLHQKCFLHFYFGIPVTTVSLLLAVAREVSSAVAFEALLALPVKARVTGGNATPLCALTGEVPRAVTLVAYT